LAFRSSIGNFQIVIFHVVFVDKKRNVNNELVTKALIFFWKFLISLL